MNTKILTTIIIICMPTAAYANKQVSKAKYIEYRSKYTITEILFQLTSGIIKDTQLITNLLDKNKINNHDAKKLQRYAKDVIETFELEIDGKKRNFSARTIIDIIKHIKEYTLDNINSGPIKYSYSFTYKNIRIKRIALMINNHIILTTRLFGIMSETIERGVTVNLIYAELILDAKEYNGTTIRSTLTAKTNIKSCRIKERIAANRVVPGIMNDQICKELYRLQNKAIEIATTGRGDTFDVTHAFIKKLATNGLK